MSDFSEKNFAPRPLLLLISGPAGSGKTTLCDRMTAAFPNISRVITCTTRPPRHHEKNGTDYHFFDNDTFEKKIANGDFLEHATVHQNHYGVQKSDVRALLEKNHDLLLNLDVQGAETVRKVAQNDTGLRRALVSVFIMPPTVEELRQRLAHRATDDTDEIGRRLRIAEIEMRRWHEYDFCLLSGDRENDFEKIQSIYRSEKMRVI